MEEIRYSAAESNGFFYNHEVMRLKEMIPTHTHNICELILVAKGSLTYVVEGKKYSVSKNTLILSRPLEAHAIIPNEPREYERYDILFDQTQYGAEIFQKIPKNVDVINVNGNELVCGLFKKMEYYCGNAEGVILQKLLKNLTEEILYNIVLLSGNESISDTGTANPVIMQAIRFINDNITEPLPIETICDALYITKSHLHRLFLTHLNTTPKKYIMLKKLRMAQAEMQAGSHPTEVAARYGFGNYATFYRNYKEHFGTVPSDYTAVTIERNYF